MCRPGVLTTIPGCGFSVLASALIESGHIAYAMESADRKFSTLGPLTLQVSSLSLPSVGAQIAMYEKVLSASVAQVLATPAVSSRRPCEFELPMLGACRAYIYIYIYINGAGVLAKLWDARLLCPCPRSCLEVGATHEVRTGLFGVAKLGSEKARVIIDRRWRSAMGRGPPQVFWGTRLSNRCHR